MGEWVRSWHGQQEQLKPSTLVRYDVAIRAKSPRWEHVPLSRLGIRTCRAGAEPQYLKARTCTIRYVTGCYR